MKIEALIEEQAHHFLKGMKTEYNGDKESIHIIRKYIKEGGITDEEYHLLKVQLTDSLKIIGIGVPFLLIPGASIVMPILIKVAGRYKIDLMPAAFEGEEPPK